LTQADKLKSVSVGDSVTISATGSSNIGKHPQLVPAETWTGS
ncbi:unnamed protein product, partial [Tetraodon nigroviridis]